MFKEDSEKISITKEELKSLVDDAVKERLEEQSASNKKMSYKEARKLYRLAKKEDKRNAKKLYKEFVDDIYRFRDYMLLHLIIKWTVIIGVSAILIFIITKLWTNDNFTGEARNREINANVFEQYEDLPLNTELSCVLNKNKGTGQWIVPMWKSYKFVIDKEGWYNFKLMCDRPAATFRIATMQEDISEVYRDKPEEQNGLYITEYRYYMNKGEYLFIVASISEKDFYSKKAIISVFFDEEYKGLKESSNGKTKIEPGKQYLGQLKEKGETDVYQFTVSKKTIVKKNKDLVTLNSVCPYFEYTLCNSSGEPVTWTDYVGYVFEPGEVYSVTVSQKKKLPSSGSYGSEYDLGVKINYDTVYNESVYYVLSVDLT